MSRKRPVTLDVTLATGPSLWRFGDTLISLKTEIRATQRNGIVTWPREQDNAHWLVLPCPRGTLWPGDAVTTWSDIAPNDGGRTDRNDHFDAVVTGSDKQSRLRALRCSDECDVLTATLAKLVDGADESLQRDFTDSRNLTFSAKPSQCQRFDAEAGEEGSTLNICATA
jgi:hypothetical protein